MLALSYPAMASSRGSVPQSAIADKKSREKDDPLRSTHNSSRGVANRESRYLLLQGRTSGPVSPREFLQRCFPSFTDHEQYSSQSHGNATNLLKEAVKLAGKPNEMERKLVSSHRCLKSKIS